MDLSPLTRWLDDRTTSHAFSGVALAYRDGEPIFSYAGGLAHRGHGVPNAPETRFAVASVTKLPVAIAALRLVDQGRIGLRTPVLDVLAPANRTAALTAEHTLHHLLSHTSGLPDYHDDAATTWDSFIGCWDRVPTYHARRPAALLPLFADLPAVAAPGEVYRYTDANFVLVGLVLEALTGRPFDEVVQTEVLSPAGLADTRFEAIDADPRRLAVGYVVDDGPWEAWRSNWFSVPANGMPDGGMISTPADLAALVRELLGGRLLSAELTAAMTTPQGPPSGEVEQYGYGCELAIRDGTVVALGHSGTDPGVTAQVIHHVASATTVVVLCNQDRGAWAAALEVLAALGLEDPRAAA